MRVCNVRTGALDHTYAAYINNGHMGESVVECGDGKSDLSFGFLKLRFVV